jgi:quercetin dioxygenase-like cupin family protein
VPNLKDFTHSGEIYQMKKTIFWIASSLFLIVGIQTKAVSHMVHTDNAVTQVNLDLQTRNSEAREKFLDHLSSNTLEFEIPEADSELTFEFPTLSIEPNPPLILGPAGEAFAFLKRGEKYTLSEGLVPPGGGPPPHIHKDYDEYFYLPDGNVKFWVGDRTYPGDSIPGENAPKTDVYSIVTKPGDLIYVPANTVHGFEAVGDEPVRMVFIWESDTTYDYFQAVGQPIEDPSNPPEVKPENKELFVSSAPQFDIIQSTFFHQYVNQVKDGFPFTDNNADGLRALLAPDTITEVDSEESSIPKSPFLLLSVLVFGGLLTTLTLKRFKH